MLRKLKERQHCSVVKGLSQNKHIYSFLVFEDWSEGWLVLEHSSRWSLGELHVLHSVQKSFHREAKLKHTNAQMFTDFQNNFHS